MPRGRIPCSLLALALLMGACSPADDVEIQPLPSLNRVSAEARAGLPEIAGVWRFAGWELAPGDSASLALPLPSLGRVWLRTQRRDSLAGFYLPAAGRAPLAGEVRRDSVVSLVTYLGPGDGRILTGRISRDTMWVEVSTLTEPGSWPRGARVAMVRTPVSSPFVRIHGAPPPPPPADTASVAADSLRADSTAVGAPAAPLATPARPAPAGPVPAAGAPAPVRGESPRVQPQPSPPATRTPARPETRTPAQPRPSQPQAAPRPRRPEPGGVPLLGEPLPDSARDTTGLAW